MRLNTVKFAICILFLGVFSSCKKDFLDRASTTQQQDEDIFTSFVMTDQVVNNLYSRMRGVYTYLGGYQMGAATDEAKDASNWMASMQFNNGSWSGNNNPIGNTWRENYVAIRQANSILEGIARYNTPDDVQNPGWLENRIGEVYFLRAWYLFELMRQFGGVIIVNSVIDQNDMEALNQPRSTYDECVAQVLRDCDEAFQRVRYTYPSNEVGRITKGAALALKSRVLLYSASPLWAEAGKNSFQANIDGPANASDPQKWQRAADAAKAVIDLRDGAGNLVYELEPNLAARQRMFITNTLTSKEVIMVRMNEGNRDQYMFPFGSNGWSGSAPSDNLVSDYEMNNGLPIDDPNSGYNPDRPYENRDPRLYSDILYNGAPWKGRRIETFQGGRDEANTNTDHSRTGYYLRKLANENATIGQGGSVRVDGIQFRLAEIYLNYAEALNEVSPGHPDILTYVNRVRTRAGQQPLDAGLSQNAMRERIQNERRIELSFENHRFWDVRRWRIAENTEQELWGMRPIADATKPDGFRYERFLVEERTWRNAMYVIPITQDETLRNPNLVQNAGW